MTIEQLQRRVEVTIDGCWLWLGALQNMGYGVAAVGRRAVLAHRLSYELHRGAIPDGLELDHLCRNPRCVNPSHLEAVTHRENIRRGRRANNGVCKNGHVMTRENIAAWAAKKGWRTCRLCVSERMKRQRDKHRERLRKHRAENRDAHNKWQREYRAKKKAARESEAA